MSVQYRMVIVYKIMKKFNEKHKNTLTIVRIVAFAVGVWVIYEIGQVYATQGGIGGTIIHIYMIGIFLLFGFLCLIESWVAISMLILLVLVHVPFGWKSMTDPCYSVEYASKGPHWHIQGDRVCVGEGSEYIRYHTLRGADNNTFKEIKGGYFQDKNHKYNRGWDVVEDE